MGLIAGTALLAGGLAAGGGILSGIGSRNAKPRQQYYGGSAQAQQQAVDQYGQRRDAGAQMATSGVLGLGNISGAGAQVEQAARARLVDSLSNNSPIAWDAGGYADAARAYDPTGSINAASQSAIDRASLANLGAARAAGPLAMRRALNANAEAGVAAAQNAAALQLQGDQLRLSALGQASGMGLQGAQLEQQRQLQRQQLLAGLQAQGYGQRADALGAQINLGAQREAGYSDAQDRVQLAQLGAAGQYEQARAARGQQQMAMGGALLGGAGQVLGMGLGGGR